MVRFGIAEPPRVRKSERISKRRNRDHSHQVLDISMKLPIIIPPLGRFLCVGGGREEDMKGLEIVKALALGSMLV